MGTKKIENNFLEEIHLRLRAWELIIKYCCQINDSFGIRNVKIIATLELLYSKNKRNSVAFKDLTLKKKW